MNSLTTVEAGRLMDGLRVDLEPLIIESGKSFDRLRSVFMIAVQQNPDILKCSENSIKREISKCAADGLVPDNKEAAMIPYKGELQYQPMVQGIIKRMKELGGVFNIVCNLVFEQDIFTLDESDPDSLSHVSDRFSPDRGQVVGGYVVFRDEQKRVMHLETMSRADFESVRKASKAPDSPAWKNWTNEMYKKAVLRRGAKYISVNNDKIRALLERQDDMFDFQQNRTTSERVNPFTGATIDGEVSGGDNSPRRDSTPVEKSISESSEPQTQQTKKKEKVMPAVPDVTIKPDDVPLFTECAQKILRIALDPTIDAPARRGVLKSNAPDWKGKLPEYLHELLKACVDMVDWSVHRSAEGLGWTAEHAMFVHKVKTILGVEKLDIGKYP